MTCTKYFAASATHLVALAVFLLLTACSGGGNKVKISGRLLNMNQATFFVYSPDGIIQGMDTVKVMGGRFEYEKEIDHSGTLAMVYPNFSTIPIFVSPGDKVSIDGNAAMISQQEIDGGDEANELFSKWRVEQAHASFAEQKKAALAFIGEHPESPASLWLVRQYYVLANRPDMAGAAKLLASIAKAQPDNTYAKLMQTQVASAGSLGVGKALPRFSAKDIDGKVVNDHQLNRGRTIVCVWATWNYDSQNTLRQLAMRRRYVTEGNSSSSLYSDETLPDHVLAICMDGSTKECRGTLKSCNAENLTNVCDTMQWDSPLVKAFAVSSIPDNIVLQDGKVVKRGVAVNDLFKK